MAFLADGFRAPDTHDELVFMARISEQAERYEEMAVCMKKLVQQSTELTIEERNLLSVAYKNVMGSRRAAWRVISVVEQKEESKGNHQYVPLVRQYRRQVEKEVADLCSDILNLVDTFLVPNASTGEARVFFYKLKGDYYRYYAEVTSDGDQKQKGLEAYQQAMEIAQTTLSTTHSIRLGLALNFSVFHYEIMRDHEKGIALAREAFDAAMADSGDGDAGGDETDYRESTLILQLIRDNLSLWTEDLDEAGGDDGTKVEDLP